VRGPRRSVGLTAVPTVAAVDCGTNSIRLLVAGLDPVSGTLVDLRREMLIVRLGEGVDRTGRLSDAALARTFAACEQYGAQISALRAEQVRFVATSATRDAVNRQVFIDGVQARLGVTPEVVDGQTEAALSFRGATAELAGQVLGPYLVVDIGGGSTEVVLGDLEPQVSCSVDVGCVRITERHLRSDPPLPAEIAAARADIEAAIDVVAEQVPWGQARTLVGLSGSVTTLAALDAALPAYDASRTHHWRLSAAAVHELTARLLAMTRAQRAALAVMHPGRVDVIAAGAMVLDALVTRVGVDQVLVSEHDILDGIAWSLLRA
jgi:exopolyphosphatase / guanosine-5'-triphosphate,3'-diphosphate pyrophosphatase